MNYIEVQQMRKEAGAFRDGLIMMSPFEHMQWFADQTKQHGLLNTLRGRGSEGFIDYLGRTGKVDFNNEWTNKQRYNQFMNGWDPSRRAIARDYGTDFWSNIKAQLGIKKPLKFGLFLGSKEEFERLKRAKA